MKHEVLKKFCKYYVKVRNKPWSSQYQWQCGFNCSNGNFKVGNGEAYQKCLKKMCPFYYWDDYCKQEKEFYESLVKRRKHE